MPVTVQQAFGLALQHLQAGRLADAESLGRQVIAANPRHAHAFQLLGVTAALRGENDVAIELIRKALQILPNFPEAYCNLGNLLRERGRLDEAITACRQAISLNPQFAEAHNNLGYALRENGQIDEAIAAYRQAIAINPDFALAHSNLGNSLRDKGELDAAIISFRRALDLKPDFPEAHNNLANGLRDWGQLDEAIVAYRKAISLRPDYAEARSNLGTALKDRGEIDEAISEYGQASALKPNLAALHSNLLATLHYHPECDAAAIFSEAKRWSARHAEPLETHYQPHHNERAPDRRLRIGYVSSDFREHACAHFFDPLLRSHDHSQFEIFCYAQVPIPDKVTQRFKELSDGWRSSVGVSDEQVAGQVRQDAIDILVDLKLHTDNHRLLVFAQRPAPVQVTWLGYPGTTGLRTIDYRLTDPYLDPPGCNEQCYSEQSIRLPDTFWCYDPLTNEPAVGPLPALSTGRVTFGCLNNLCKINDQVLRLFAKVLAAVQRSKLLILAPEGGARQRIRSFLQRQGVDSDRVEFLSKTSRQQYLQMYNKIDIALDTLPYNGHTTSFDSFWMGVPVITLVGERVVGRAGMSQLMNLGLPELIAQTPEEYVRISAGLAGDLHRLAQLRSSLRERMAASPLMDASRFARNVEAAYRQMWIRWCRAERHSV